jgi:hypothetical protein
MLAMGFAIFAAMGMRAERDRGCVASRAAGMGMMPAAAQQDVHRKQQGDKLRHNTIHEATAGAQEQCLHHQGDSDSGQAAFAGACFIPFYRLNKNAALTAKRNQRAARCHHWAGAGLARRTIHRG